MRSSRSILYKSTITAFLYLLPCDRRILYYARCHAMTDWLSSSLRTLRWGISYNYLWNRIDRSTAARQWTTMRSRETTERKREGGKPLLITWTPRNFYSFPDIQSKFKTQDSNGVVLSLSKGSTNTTTIQVSSTWTNSGMQEPRVCDVTMTAQKL